MKQYIYILFIYLVLKSIERGKYGHTTKTWAPKKVNRPLVDLRWGSEVSVIPNALLFADMESKLGTVKYSTVKYMPMKCFVVMRRASSEARCQFSMTLYTVQCTLYSVHHKVHSVKCTVQSIKCIVYSVKCTV